MQAEDRLITLISRWLGRHIGNADLRRQIDAIGADGLAPGQLAALEELVDELGRAEPGQRGHLEMVARETLEALALRE